MVPVRPWILVLLVGFGALMKSMGFTAEALGFNVDPVNGVYPWNFSPLMAICLFGAATLTRPAWAFIVPLLSMLVGDVVIGLVTGQPALAVYPNQPVVYATFMLCTLLGCWLRGRRSVLGIAGIGLLSELIFFAVTNFGTWWFQRGIPGAFYASDLSGLTACYVAGLPFLRRSLMSTWLYSGMFFGALAWYQAHAAARSEQLATVE
jgi:hypothetical protein